MNAKRSEPWQQAAPKRSRHTKLSSRRKAVARTKARRAGRAYPNLVDNMNAAKKQRARAAGRKRSRGK